MLHTLPNCESCASFEREDVHNTNNNDNNNNNNNNNINNNNNNSSDNFIIAAPSDVKNKCWSAKSPVTCCEEVKKGNPVIFLSAFIDGFRTQETRGRSSVALDIGICNLPSSQQRKPENITTLMIARPEVQLYDSLQLFRRDMCLLEQGIEVYDVAVKKKANVKGFIAFLVGYTKQTSINSRHTGNQAHRNSLHSWIHLKDRTKFNIKIVDYDYTRRAAQTAVVANQIYRELKINKSREK